MYRANSSSPVMDFKPASGTRQQTPNRPIAKPAQGLPNIRVKQPPAQDISTPRQNLAQEPAQTNGPDQNTMPANKPAKASDVPHKTKPATAFAIAVAIVAAIFLSSLAIYIYLQS